MSSETEERLAQALQRALKEKGYRLTPARVAIVAALVACGGHITADDLVARVHLQSAAVGRMTVYRTLELLSELGLIRPVYQGTGAAHYILLAEGHHHHLVCAHCARVIEFDDCMLENLGQVIAERYNFQLQSHLLELFGLCQECQDG